MIRTLIVDDHAIVRRGLTQIVAQEADMIVAGEAANAQEMLAFVRRQPCDVVVSDISMPGRSGLDALRDLKQERPSLPVLILSVHPEDQYGVRALRLGASGYLTKDSAPEELVTAIRKVVTGGTYVSPTLAEQLALTPETEPPPHETLP
ncbi:MAG TPA: response regulator transcription factor [Candidatus Methylomirabilis sp.]|nr:response regulator transcription factor [Candidatus Methylomirabilis sp.]